MGDLNNIQDDIYAEMQGDLADVAFPYVGAHESDAPFDPENPIPSAVEYDWVGIFGLAFTVKDTQLFKIQESDQKGIVFKRAGNDDIPYAPQLNEIIIVRGQVFTIIDMRLIPADNGWTLQLRRYG